MSTSLNVCVCVCVPERGGIPYIFMNEHILEENWVDCGILSHVYLGPQESNRMVDPWYQRLDG